MARQIPDHSLESVINDGDLFLLRRVSDGVDVKIPGSLILRAAQLAANGGTIPETDRTNTFSADQDMGGNKITGIGAPVATDDASRKGDLDAHTTDTTNPHSVTKAQVGLANVPDEDATDMANWDQKGATAGQVPVWDGAAWAPGDAAGIFTESFESAEQTITVGSATTVAHGLAGVPTMTDVIMRCKTAEGGYAIGDEFSLRASQDGTNMRGVSAVADATNIVIVVASSHDRIANKGTGAAFVFTPANWRLVARAWR